MKSNSLSERLAVCSWSLQPVSPADLVSNLECAGIRRVADVRTAREMVEKMGS